ncbi:hypothetical protein C8R43DRAFT_983288 [Mycena crocata]|nr:hypothetical protein C8R43DRAFT_983288 [Mycena crocata]
MSYLSTDGASKASPKSESDFIAPMSALAHTTRPDNDSRAGRRPPSRRSQRGVPGPLKGASILTAFLPIPPVLSIIYLASGHAVLRATHSAHFDSVPLISSVRAAAAGGAILSIPLAALLYLLLFPTKPPDPEDFFDDNDDTGEPLATYGTYALGAVLMLILGAIAGALGTVCLPANIMLSAGEAAEAGIVGGAIVCGGFTTAAFIVFMVWWDFYRPKRRTDEPE